MMALGGLLPFLIFISTAMGLAFQSYSLPTIYVRVHGHDGDYILYQIDNEKYHCTFASLSHYCDIDTGNDEHLLT